ncbi:unnamed protein product [Brugia timori]|uniref:Uncharacterized protein n=1 Tax=Brugia timori TaxID=42155 RepID=A0A0R3R613_9BILA|nr:unnamed protein product [Brugia timori]
MFNPFLFTCLPLSYQTYVCVVCQLRFIRFCKFSNDLLFV